MHELEPNVAEVVEYALHVVTPRRKPTGKNQTDSSELARKDGLKRRPGRPPVHAESWTKVTVVLFDRQIEFLDRLADNIRAQHGVAISRAQLIRALVDSVGDSMGQSTRDLVDRGTGGTDTASGAELTQSMLARLGVVRSKN
jgi:hypothetical protein